MAKTSQVLRDQRRAKLIAKHAEKRAELRARLKDPEVTAEEKFDIQAQFARLPRNSVVGVAHLWQISIAQSK